ncbi:MAG: hypothetical protein AABZ39_08465 [Spirochaetota bacterium]
MGILYTVFGAAAVSASFIPDIRLRVAVIAAIGIAAGVPAIAAAVHCATHEMAYRMLMKKKEDMETSLKKNMSIIADSYSAKISELSVQYTDVIGEHKARIDGLTGLIEPVGTVLADKTKGLSVLMSQLDAVREQIETTGMSLSKNFMEITMKARGQAKAAAQIAERYAVSGALEQGDLTALAGGTEALAKDTSAVIIAMQYHDIIRQRVEHVLMPLAEFSAEIDALADSMGAVATGKSDHIARWLSRFYTMKEEKEIMHKTLASQQD